MADTFTPNYNLIKPDPAGNADVGELSSNFNAIDTALKANADGVTALNTTPAPTDITANVTASTGFTVAFAQAVKIGKMCQIDVRVTRTGGTIAAANVGNVAMCTLPAGYRPKITCGITTSGFGGIISAAINTNGQIDLAAVANDWPNNSDISFSAFFFIP